MFDSYTNSKIITQNTNVAGVSARCATRTNPVKLHQCTRKCTHEAQKEYDSENEDEIREKYKDTNIQTVSDETKDVKNKSTVHYHFANIVAEEIKNLPPSKRIKVMSEILNVIGKNLSD